MSTETLIGLATDNPIIPQNILNLKRKDFADTRVLLGELPGLVDSINRVHTDLYDHYKNLRSLDWDELEYRYEQCIPEFDASSRDDYEIMTDNVSYQWSADTAVANGLAQVFHAVITNTEASLGYAKIVENENLHALTYSEIARMAFKDPTVVLARVMANSDIHNRLSDVAAIMEEARIAAAKYSIGLATKEEIMDIMVLFFCAIPTLERCQFMPSFAVTFAYGEDGRFMPIVNAVQKICQDELEVHIPFNMAVVRNIVSHSEGRESFNRIRGRLTKLVNDINAVENEWISRTLEGRKHPSHFNIESLRKFNDFSCTYMARFFEIEKDMDFDLVDINPLPYMERWTNLSLVQTSPQEQENGQYKVNVLRRDDQGTIFTPRF